MAELNNDYYYLYDHIFSAAALIDSNFDIVEMYEYNAYGQPQVYTDGNFMDDGDDTVYTASQNGNPYLFTGREVDDLDGSDLVLQYNEALNAGRPRYKLRK